MNKELFSRYAEIKQKVKELEEEIATIGPTILSEIQEAGVDKVETDDGSFIVECRKDWTYSEAVSALDSQLKELKKKEMADGTAMWKEKNFIKFVIKK